MMRFSEWFGCGALLALVAGVPVVAWLCAEQITLEEIVVVSLVLAGSTAFALASMRDGGWFEGMRAARRILEGRGPSPAPPGRWRHPGGPH